MVAVPLPPSILTFEEARATVEHCAAKVFPGKIETSNLRCAAGRVLAQDVIADRDFPPFRRAMRDGYAVRAADLEKLPANLKVIGEIKAGATMEELPGEVGPGQAAAIMTGAPAPNGADAVVMVEYTTSSGDVVTVNRGLASGDNLVPAGSEAKQGETLLRRGTRL